MPSAMVFTGNPKYSKGLVRIILACIADPVEMTLSGAGLAAGAGSDFGIAVLPVAAEPRGGGGFEEHVAVPSGNLRSSYPGSTSLSESMTVSGVSGSGSGWSPFLPFVFPFPFLPLPSRRSLWRGPSPIVLHGCGKSTLEASREACCSGGGSATDNILGNGGTANLALEEERLRTRNDDMVEDDGCNGVESDADDVARDVGVKSLNGC